jgi:putative phosphoesterase
LVIAVISDTHKYGSIIERVLESIKDADMVIHLGDVVQDAEYIAKHFKGETIYVSGNCDMDSFVPSERTEIIEGKKVFITHGHNYHVKEGLLKLKYKAEEIGANIVLYGHTHLSLIQYYGDVLFINPGSPSICREGQNSVAIIEINNGEVNATIRSIIVKS